MIGNRCGHIPTQPNFYIPPQDQKRYHCLAEGIRRSKAIYTNPYIIEESAAISFHSKAGERVGRKRKSERREILAAQIIPLLLHYLDLKTMQFGLPNNPFGYGFISKTLKVSSQRVKRAMKNLKEAGFIEVIPLIRQVNGKPKTVSVSILVNETLFASLQLNEQLALDRKRAYAKEMKHRQITDKKSLYEITAFKNKTYNSFNRSKSKQAKQEKKAAILSPQQKKALLSMAEAMHKKDKAKTRSEYYAELQHEALKHLNKAPPH